MDPHHSPPYYALQPNPPSYTFLPPSPLSSYPPSPLLYLPLTVTLTSFEPMSGPTRTARPTGAKPPRPPNAWILYRSDRLRAFPPAAPGAPRRPQSEISKEIARMWKNEAEETKSEYERRAELAKAEHARQYPNYRFCPMKKADKDKLREEAKAEKERVKAEIRKARQRSVYPYPTTASIASSSTPYLEYIPAPSWGPEGSRGIPGLSPPWSQSSSPAASTLSADSPGATAAQASPLVDSSLQLPDTCTSGTPRIPSAVPERPSSTRIPSVSDEATPAPSNVQSIPQPSLPQVEPASVTHQWMPVLNAPTSTVVANAGDTEPVSSWPNQTSLFEQQFDQDALSFQIPQMDTAQGFASGALESNEMQALLASTGDPSVFQVDVLGSTLPNDPPENIEFSIGQSTDLAYVSPEALAQFLSQFPFDTLEGFAPPTAEPTVASMDGMWYQQTSGHDDQESFNEYNNDSMFQYVNFDTTSASTSTNTSASDPSNAEPIRHFSGYTEPSMLVNPPPVVHTSPQEVQPQPSAQQTYVPPSGATNAGIRRVGGSWRPPSNLRRSSVDSSRASSWTVPA